MRFSARARQWLSSTACFAVLLSALAPTLSLALAHSERNAWADICSSSSAAPLDRARGAGKGSAPAAPIGHTQHCPYCSVHVAALGPPPSATLERLLPVARFALPRSAQSSPQPLIAWRSGQPRAPPAAL